MMQKYILNDLANGLDKRAIAVIDVSKEYYLSKVEGFCVANAMKVLHLNLVKIRSVPQSCSSRKKS